VSLRDTEDLYRGLRSYAFAIAYRMLGSVSEAEDVVQEAFVRLGGARGDIENPKAYLATITTRLAIDALRAARRQRETYCGPWLPEPLVNPDPAELTDVAGTAESLTMAFLVLLETLSPTERAVFLLRDVFDYDYPEIAQILGKNEAACRQLASRARRRIESGKPRFEVSRDEQDKLAQRFFAACRDGDMAGLIQLLAGDAAFYGDGGIKGTGVPRPIYGRDNVVKLLLGLFRHGRRLGIRIRTAVVNAQPGALCLDAEGRLINVMCLDIVGGAVHAVRSVVNPDKLGHLGTLSPIGRRARQGG
jgi:RNA polymerase sigma-70 factor (ECF subfamily)